MTAKRADDTAADKENRQEKDMRQDKITNRTIVSYEDRAGAKYSHADVLTVGEDEESSEDGSIMDAASPLPL